jgi:hypothetical protein
MKPCIRVLTRVAIFIALFSTVSSADDVKPIKAIMFVGGCCHDYKQMPLTLANSISELANVKIDIRAMATADEMAAAFREPSFGQGYDIIIYDICFGEKWKDGDYDAALRLADEGKPAMFVHCSAHTYRPPRDKKAANLVERETIADAKWHALVGMDSRVHDKYVGFSTEKADKQSPILKTFPDDWKTAGDEMYNTIKLMPSASALLTATSPASGKTHIVAWTNHYGKARIFGTTLGHDMKTGGDPYYQKLLANGLLWACDKLGPDGKPVAGYGK